MSALRPFSGCSENREDGIEAQVLARSLASHPNQQSSIWTEVPAGVDRRAFMMRSAVVGAVAVITGCSRGRDGSRPRAAAPPPAADGAALVARPRRREEGQGAGDDDARRVLQGRARAVELAHHRPDAHHLRLLPALHEAARRTSSRRRPAMKVHLFGSLSATGKGHGTERAALAGVIGKEPATVDPLFLDEPARQAGPDLPGEARRQDLQRSRSRTSSTTRPRATSRTRTR